VIDIYGGEPIVFGPHYILPKPFDNRLLEVVSNAVSKAAIESGVAQLEAIPAK
jgi:malate dehydrogenase (oxaloacetate-decarboxylating)(NADP+)